MTETKRIYYDNGNVIISQKYDHTAGDPLDIHGVYQCWTSTGKIAWAYYYEHNIPEGEMLNYGKSYGKD